jgi:hypothetical protein
MEWPAEVPMAAPTAEVLLIFLGTTTYTQNRKERR